MSKKILVLGGYGTFGRRISTAIARIPFVECVIGGRRPPPEAAPVAGDGARTVAVDIHDSAALRRALEGVFAVVNTVGPFQARDYSVAALCAEMGVHYVDLADARAYVGGIDRLQQRAQQTGCLIVTGASTVPAVSAALVDLLRGEFDRIDEIHTCISPGNKNPRGAATVRAILSYTGSPLRLRDKGRWREARGWGEPETVVFPAPVGRRRVYLCDVPDLDLFPARYGAQTVTFRAGLQLNVFNYGISLLGWMKRHGWIKDLPRLAPFLIYVSNAFRAAGDAAGGMRVLVRGQKHGRETEHAAFLIARDDNGPAIPCSPSVALIRKWVQHGVPQTGATACVDLLTWEDIKAELLDYDIVLVRS
jgi:saccharopine dehydrogenase-like NADP-dependent oxidoreductase